MNSKFTLLLQSLSGKWQTRLKAAGLLFLAAFFGTNLFAQITVNGNPNDWPAVLTNNALTTKVFVHDANNTNDNQFTNGSQDPDLLAEWGWVLGNTNDKGDISNSGVFLSGSDLFFFGDRTAINGDAQIGFWFFKGNVSPLNTGKFGPDAHQDGDLLVLSNFTNGGGSVNLEIYRWTGSPGALVHVGSTAANPTYGNASVSSAYYPVPASGPFLQVFQNKTDLWTYQGKSVPSGAYNNTPVNGLPTGEVAPNTYAAGAFFEGVIHLATIPGASPCIQSYLLETRNSQSDDASLQDFVASGFNGVPQPPSVAPTAKCYDGTAATATGSCNGNGTIKFYAEPSGGSVVTPSRTAVGTSTFYAACDNNGCESSRVPVTVTIYSKTTLSLGKDDVTCNGGSNGRVTATFANGTAPYKIQINEGSFVSNVTSPYTFNNLPAGTYNIHVVDAHNCDAARTIKVNEAPALTLSLQKSDVSCNGGTNGSVTATFSGGSGQFQARIDGGSFTDVTSPKVFGGLSAGSHTVVIRDKNDINCTKSASISIDQPTLLTLSLQKSDVTCNGGNNGSVTATFAGGTAPYKIQINGGSFVTNVTSPHAFNNLGAASYTVHVVDAHNCEATKSITVGQAAALNLSLTKVDVTCNGGTNGSITATFSGGSGVFQASLDGAAFADATSPKVFGGLSAGSHTIVVRDKNDANCSKSDSRTIDQPAVLSLSLNKSDVTCNGGTNGSVTATFSGGSGQFQARIDGGSFTDVTSPKVFGGLSAGSHTIVVRDKNDANCSKASTTTVDQNPCQVNCTYTQGYYGNPTGLSCSGEPNVPKKYTTADLMTKAINSYTVNSYDPPLSGIVPFVDKTLVIGKPGHSIYMTSNDVAAIIEYLPGGGGSKPLNAGNVSIGNAAGMAQYLKGGRIANTLLAQTMTLGLNMGVKSNLKGFALQKDQYLVTQDIVECGSTATKSCSNVQWHPPVTDPISGITTPGYYSGYTPYKVFDKIPAALYNAISPKTVDGLFTFANYALGGGSLAAYPGVDLNMIANAEDLINNAFDQCRAFYRWAPAVNGAAPSAYSFCLTQQQLLITMRQPAKDQLPTGSMQIAAYPNPYYSTINFHISSPSEGKATLELFDLAGRRLALVYKGILEAGIARTISYQVPASQKVPMIYKMTIGDKSTYGKILPGSKE